MEGNFSNRVRDVISYSREEAIRLGYVDEATFDRVVRPEDMVAPA